MKSTPLYQEDHQWMALARDPERPEKIIDTNQFLLTKGDRAMVVEPGGIEIFPAMLSAVLQHVPVEAITDLFASHQDPDIISSLGLWDSALPTARLHAPWMWEGFIRHFGCNRIRYQGIPDQGMDITVGQARLQALPAHFLHSSGNFHLYDPGAKLLMSGDVGMAIEPEQETLPFFVEDFDAHIQYMEPLHRRWMPSEKAIKEWVARVRDLDVDMLVPQHGRILRGDDVTRFLDWFEQLEVGQTK